MTEVEGLQNGIDLKRCAVLKKNKINICRNLTLEESDAEKTKGWVVLTIVILQFSRSRISKT